MLIDGTVLRGHGSETVYVRPGKHHLVFQRIHVVPTYRTFQQDVRDADGNVEWQTTGSILDPSSLNGVVESEKALDVVLQAGQRYSVTAP